MTERLPFDPSKMAVRPGPAPAPPTGGADAPLTVSQLAGRISAALDSGLPARVRVIGEISGFRERTHWYFDLKDAGAVVSCALFASAARRVRFTPRGGQEVVVSGRVEFYDKAGKVSLIVDKIEPVGAGALELAFRALCEELRALGWFDPSRKRHIPFFPRRVAVVTSRSAAALQDVLDTMRRRCPATDVALVDVRVQGDGAAGEIADAIGWLGVHHRRLGVEAILVTRGGGSMEDLWAFNERVVAEAIVNSPVPVVAAIGHETDTTIAELVADLRGATPTQAAMRLTPDRLTLLEQLDSLAGRARSGMQRGLVERRRRLARAATRPFMADPRELVTRERRHLEALAKHVRASAGSRVRGAAHRLERLAGRLEAHRPAVLQARRASALESAKARLLGAVQRRLAGIDLSVLADRLADAWDSRSEREEARLAGLARQLAAVGPASVLRRGFSYTLRDDGTLVRSPSDVAAGQRLITRLAEGEVRSIVEPEGGTSRHESPEEVLQAARPAARRKRSRALPADQMDLFRPSP